MQNIGIISPGFSDIYAIREKFFFIKNVVFHNALDQIEEYQPAMILDLAFDYFNRSIDAEFLFQLFSALEPVLRRIQDHHSSLTVLRHFPISSNMNAFNYVQRILDDYTRLLTDYFGIKLLYVPSIVSRYCLNDIHNPVITILNGVRSGKTAKIPVTDQSIFSLIYGLDFIHCFSAHMDDIGKKDIIIEGNNITIQEIYRICKELAGIDPIEFDKRSVVQYHIPDIKALFINKINYNFENIVIDLMSNLF